MTKHKKIYIPVARITNHVLSDGEYNCGETFLEEKQNVIVLTEDELLNIMQEAMEHTIPAQLLRTSAEALVKSRMDN